MRFWRSKLRSEVESLRSELAAIKNVSYGSVSLTDLDSMSSLFGLVKSLAGPVVSAETALRSSAVFACVRLIAGCVSSSPLLTYKGRYGVKGERGLALDHPRAYQLRLQPCGQMTASTFWKFIMQCKLLNGNAYAVITPDALIPLKPSRVTPYQAWELGLDTKLGMASDRLYYYVTWDNGKFEVFDQSEMLHFPNLGWDGKQGVSTIAMATQNIGLAIAQDEYTAKFFGQGARYDVALKYPQKVSKDTADRIREHYLEKRVDYSGNATIPLILSEGGDLKEMSMTARDAQALEARQYSVIDQCRWFGVPPVMIGESEKTSSWGAGVEQVGRWFVMFTLNDHFSDIEQEIERKLFPTGRFFAEFDESELTRGDTKTRGDYYRIARGSMQEPGWMTTEEIRIEEGFSPQPTKGELQKPIQGGGNEQIPATSQV